MPTLPQERSRSMTTVRVTAGLVHLEGDLTLPEGAQGLALFAHGSGSSRFSSHNRHVARELSDAGLGTLLIDLLTAAEEEIDQYTAELRFDIDMLADRLVGAIDWLRAHSETHELPIGLFGASTGGGAALVAAARRMNAVSAVVSRGGRPDLAGPALARVRAPTLLVVGGEDRPVIALNRVALRQLRCECRMEIVPGTTYLFEEPAALEQVADLARDWFLQYLRPLSVGQISP